jgi:hypothetical protein
LACSDWLSKEHQGESKEHGADRQDRDCGQGQGQSQERRQGLERWPSTFSWLPVDRLDLENPAAVTRAAPFTGSFPAMGPPVLQSEGVDAWFNAALQSARMVMAGAFVGGC